MASRRKTRHSDPSSSSLPSDSYSDPFEVSLTASTEFSSSSSPSRTRSSRPDPFNYTDNSDDRQPVTRRALTSKAAKFAAPSKAPISKAAQTKSAQASPATMRTGAFMKGKGSVVASPAVSNSKAPAVKDSPAVKSNKSSLKGSPAIPATPATPSVAGTPLKTPNRKKEVAQIKKANDQKNLFQVPAGREAKRKPTEEHSASPAAKKTRGANETPKRVQTTPISKRVHGAGAPSAVRALSWQQVKPLKTVSPVSFYGKKDEEELEMNSFLCEDNGVLVRTTYKQKIAEAMEAVEEYKERMATSQDKAVKAQKKIDELKEKEDPEDEEALQQKQKRVQQLEKTLERFVAANERQKEILLEKEKDLENLQASQDSVYFSPGGMPVQVKQSGAIYGLGDETQYSTICLVPKIFVKRGVAGGAEKAQLRCSRMVMKKEYAGETWSTNEVDIDLVKEMGRKK